MGRFLNDWKASILGTFILLFAAVIPNILTLGLLGLWSARKNPVEIRRINHG